VEEEEKEEEEEGVVCEIWARRIEVRKSTGSGRTSERAPPHTTKYTTKYTY